MQVFTKPIPASKGDATIRFIPSGLRSGVLAITQGRDFTEYTVTEFDADGGRAFRFEKISNGTDREADAYDVFCGCPCDSCECRGFLRHGHCKHLAAAHVIIAEGMIAPVAPKPVAMKPAPRFAEPLLNAFFGKPATNAAPCTSDANANLSAW